MNGSAKAEHPLRGAWELVSGTYIREDGTALNYEEAGVQSLKVLSENRYSFTTTAQGEFYAAGGGEYFTDENTYVEIPALVSHASMAGQRYEFQYQLENDIWTNERWEEGICVEREIWRRVA